MLYFASYINTNVDTEAREADADDLREELAADLEELDAEHPEYKFGKVNVDEQPELAGQFRIMSIPTLMVFRGGQAAAVKVGVTPKEELLKLLG